MRDVILLLCRNVDLRRLYHELLERENALVHDVEKIEDLLAIGSVHEYTKMIEEIDSLRRNNKILGIRTVEQDKILQSIFNSLSWKLVSSMRNITSFFR